MPQAVLGHNGLNSLKSEFAISRPWGSGRPKRIQKTHNIRKLRTPIPDRIFHFGTCSGPLAPANCAFLFLAQSWNLSKCSRPKTGQNTTKSPFPTAGGPNEKKLSLRKLRKTIPDSVVTFFFNFGTPAALGPRKGPVGLACCLLAC